MKHPCGWGPCRAAIAASVAIAASCVAPANAATCTIAASPVAFGEYNVITKAEIRTTNAISMTCTGFGSVFYTITLSPGQSGVAASRYLASGSQRLSYQVYADSARTQVLGDGSGGTRTLSGNSFVFFAPVQMSGTLYPVLFSGQNPAPGTYTDTLTLQVTY